MIDIENDVFTIAANELRAAHDSVNVSMEYTATPSKFPSVTIVESDNRVYDTMRTSATIERAVRVMYEVNVYSNKTSGKKTEAKSLADTVDATFTRLGFTRTYRNQVPNFLDATIYRIVMRYEALVVPNANGKFCIHTI